MKFKGHQTFYIRRGWLTKGLKKLIESNNPRYFTDKTIDRTTDLGVGSNMVNAIRYYLPVVGLTNESRVSGQDVSDIGKLIYDSDKYMQQYGTLIWLHYKLATNKDNATSWYYFFNEYKSMEIDRESFLDNIKDFINQTDESEMPAEKSIDDDYTCILNTYLPRDNDKDSFEDNLECPFAELGLLTQTVMTSGKIIRKTPCDVSNFPTFVALAILRDYMGDEQKEIKIENIQKAPNLLGKVFNLGILDISTILERMQNDKLIKIVRTAGIETVQVIGEYENYSPLKCLTTYYEMCEK